MKYDEKRVDEAVLALMHLTTFRDASGYRTWKGHDWEVLDRLHQSNEGQRTSEELFTRNFT